MSVCAFAPDLLAMLIFPTVAPNILIALLHATQFTESCQLSSIDGQAFDNLKLIVELDFSWNKLSYVPVPQMRKLRLLRRLSMRGNPLGQLTDLTLAGGLQSRRPLSGDKGQASQEQQQAATVTGSPSLSSSASFSSQLSEAAQRQLANMSRLLETYPELFSAQQEGTAGSSAHHDAQTDSQFVLERFAEEPQREALVWWLQNQSPTRRVNEEPAEEFVAEDELDNSASDASNDASAAEQENNNEQVTAREDKLQLAARHVRLSQFEQLQELDFGHCHLSYIQAAVLADLASLKRLLLDGNQLR